VILIFDLDDTLYDEAAFVDGGLKAVAQYGATQWGWDAGASLETLRSVLATEGRGKVFDRWLEGHGALTKGRVRDCLRVYRAHRPDIALTPAAQGMIDRYGAKGPLYLVTDGHKRVQQSKVDALNLWPLFQRVFITHRYGVAASKPSTLCFEKIRAEAGCDWQDMVYVGDNPAKDFVNLNPLGVLTIRVLTGVHRQVVARPGYEARLTIEDLSGLPAALATRFGDLA
jgi:putative hydrolase of the HAD superfamily